MSFKRAVTEEQKNLRRQKILSTARNLFEKGDFKTISIAEIAKNSEIAKGSVFLYFKTKEELFLCLTIEEFVKWNEEFDKRLEETFKEKAIARDQLLALIDDTLLNNSVLIRLLAMVNVTLEHNVSYEKAFEFKKVLLSRMHYTGQLLDKSFNSFHDGDGIQFLLYCYTLIVGVHQVSNPAPILTEVLQNKEFDIFRIDFKTYFLEMLKHLLNDMVRK